MKVKSRTSTYQSLPDSELITNPTRVVRLLERLAKQHTLLTIRIPGDKEHYTSCIVGIDKPYVLLDELLPTSGHKVLLAKRTLQVTGQLEGIHIRFTTTLERVDNLDDVITYHANLPGQLEYRQRRLDYRAHIPMMQTLRIIIEGMDGTPIEGRLHDLSRSGAGMNFPDIEPSVEPGRLHECAIELPDEIWVYTTVELRHTKNIPARDRQLIGARFVGLHRAQERLVARCISNLEREFIRKRVVD